MLKILYYLYSLLKQGSITSQVVPVSSSSSVFHAGETPISFLVLAMAAHATTWERY